MKFNSNYGNAINIVDSQKSAFSEIHVYEFQNTQNASIFYEMYFNINNVLISNYPVQNDFSIVP